MEVGVTVIVAEGVTKLIGVGVKKMILIAPSSGTGESTFFPVSMMPMIIMIKKKPMMIPEAATVFVLSSILI